MRISDWSSDVCSSDLLDDLLASNLRAPLLLTQACVKHFGDGAAVINLLDVQTRQPLPPYAAYHAAKAGLWSLTESLALELAPRVRRSEEHTSELQSLMRISYAVFCLKKKKKKTHLRSTLT